MEQWPTLEEQIKEAGIHYPRSYDIAYRIGYVLQSTGVLVFAVLYGVGTELVVIPLVIFDAGVALSSTFLLVWRREIKRFILGSTIAGISLQLVSLFTDNYSLSKEIFLLGVGLTLVGGAGIAGKEAYCFRFNEGWLLMTLYPLALVPNLFGFSTYTYNLIILCIIALLQVSLLRKKLSQPLLKHCEENVCGLPEKMEK